MKLIKFFILLSLISVLQIDAKNKKKKKPVCCPAKEWTTKEACKADEGNFILSDQCCEETYLGKGEKGQVCCGACTEDSPEPGVD